jgi:transcriptional regulator with XRE-family HTH domain
MLSESWLSSADTTLRQKRMETSFGDVLKEWRGVRRLSQLDLGLAANVSARHISFLETGRAAPSRSMVMQLSETMQVPRAARNTLLKAAGFAEAYRNRNLDEADMKPILAAVEWTLSRHDPYPAFAFDKHWTLLRMNEQAGRLLGSAGIQPGDSLLEAFLHSKKLRGAIDNWAEVAKHLIARLRSEDAQLGGDPVLNGAANELANDVTLQLSTEAGTLSAVVPTRYRFGGQILSFFSTIAQFGTAEDIALADLKIELMFPADEETRNLLNAA